MIVKRAKTATDAPEKENKAKGLSGTCALGRAEEEGILQVIDAEGRETGMLPVPELSYAELQELYEMMVLVRLIDERGFKLQRSGRVEFWIPHRGLEAVHTAATLAFDRKDWIFHGYRHPGCLLMRGVPLVQLFAQFFGRADEPLKGRRLPTLMGDRRANIVPMTTQVSSYVPHAGGAAWAAKIKGDDTLFLTLFGDGSTSRGEFHSAMNFAGVHKLPVVFICENNGWAVTTPTDVQTATQSFAEKGNAYGVRNLRVDGNDPLAVYAVVSEARELARTQGPTLIEAVTYRMGLHTTSDNPDLYRTPEQVASWEVWNPLNRLRKYLEAAGEWDSSREDEVRARYTTEIDQAIRVAEAMPFPEPETMFDDTFAERTWMLEEQKARLLGELER